jgi:hypothetical protein
MRLFTSLAIVVLFLLQSGCVVISSYAKLEPQLEQWEEDREYGRSLDALGQIGPKDPDYSEASKVRKQVEKQAADYEQQIRKETSQKQKEDNWAGALDQYDEALSKHPKSVVIKDGLAKLHQQQRANLDMLERKRLIQHGEWLRDVLPVYREIARVDPRSNESQLRLKRIVSEAEAVSQELALIGNKALADNDPHSAEATLPLAFSLNNDPVIEESLNTLRAKQQQTAKEQRTKHQQKQQKTRTEREEKERSIRATVKLYDKAFAEQEYLVARAQLAKIEQIDSRYDKLNSMKKILKTAVDNKVSQLFEVGVSAYSRGQFEQAAREWRGVLSLEPEHQQAKENLERAEKVLEKLETLKKKQGG